MKAEPLRNKLIQTVDGTPVIIKLQYPQEELVKMFTGAVKFYKKYRFNISLFAKRFPKDFKRYREETKKTKDWYHLWQNWLFDEAFTDVVKKEGGGTK